MLISTIIPVYNTGPYLKRCIDSIINAQIDGISNEIILINDGSTDNSLEICQYYEKNFSNIKLISQVNQGLPSVKITGINASNGDYMTFVDSDDWVDINYYSLIFFNINKFPTAEIFVYNYRKVIGSISKLNIVFDEFDKLYNNKDIVNLLKNTCDTQFLLFTPTKVYSKNVVNASYFNKKISLGEDTLFNLKTFYNAKYIVFINDCFYNYFYNENSITSQKFKPKLIEDMERHFDAKISFYKSKVELNNKKYFKDLARVNLEKTFYSFLGNSLAKPNSDFIQELKVIRDTDLIKFGFDNCSINDVKDIKKKITLLLFKWRCYNVLKLIYKK